MSVEHHNVDDGILQPDVSISIDRENKWVLRETFVGKYSSVLNEIPAAGTAHGTYSYLSVDTADFTGQEGDQASLSVSYVGTNNEDTEGGGGEQDEDLPTPPGATFSMDVTTSTEPLIAHPRYTGTGSDVFTAAEKEAAKKVLQGNEEAAIRTEVEGATRGDDFLAQFDEGQEAFLSQGVTLTVSYYNTLPVSAQVLKLVGRIVTAPYLPAATPKNWLFTGASQQTEGSGFNIKYSYRLSGEKGWNTKIYGTDTEQGI